MKNNMETMMAKLEMEELEAVSGGIDSSEAFDIYADYLNMLYDKYGYRGVGGVAYLKSLCTPEERARISELWQALLYADDVRE